VVAPRLAAGRIEAERLRREALALVLARRLGRRSSGSSSAASVIRRRSWPRPDPGDRARGDLRRKDPRSARELTGQLRRVSSAGHRRHRFWAPGVSGAYDVAATIRVTGVFTNTTPTTRTGGAGRPEATYAIELRSTHWRGSSGRTARDPPGSTSCASSPRRSPPGSPSTRATTTRISIRPRDPRSRRHPPPAVRAERAR